MNNRQEELKEVTIVLRSLITSSKTPATLNSIERDYFSVEEQVIPFKKLGFRNTLELLEATNEFQLQKTGREIFVSAKANPKSAHIASMVKHQKGGKQQKIATHHLNPISHTPPIRSKPTPQQQRQQSLLERQLEAVQLKPLHKELHRLGQEVVTLEKTIQETQQWQQQQILYETQRLYAQHHYDLSLLKSKITKEITQELFESIIGHNTINNNNNNNNNNKNRKTTQLLTQPRNTAKDSKMMNGNTAGPAAATNRKPNLRPILGHSAPLRPPAAEQNSAAAGSDKRRLHQQQQPHQQQPLKQQHPRIQYPNMRTGGAVSVNYRLKQQQAGSTVGGGAATTAPTSTAAVDEVASATPAAVPLLMTPPNTPKIATTNHKPKSTNPLNQQPIRPNLNYKFELGFDPICSLNQYCVAMGYTPPEFEFPSVVKSPMLHCKVRVGSNIYTSYPEEHTDKAKAMQRTAEVAIERLKLQQAQKNLSILSDSEFLDGLYQELIKHPHGIVSHKLPEWYQATANRQVPSNWLTLLSSSPKIRIECNVNTNIIFANTGSNAESGTTSPQPPNVDTTVMPELKLPWQEGQQDWSMYITHCDNTMHVWARLIDQSSSFEKLTEQLNAHMARPQNRQVIKQQPVEQFIYLVEVSDTWNRVRAMSVDLEQRECSCHFVDFGEEVVFGFDALFVCPAQFLALPAQAVCLSMYALDKFEDHPHALPVLEKELAGHSVVTRIITSESQFLRLGGRTQGVLLAAEQQSDTNGDCGSGSTGRRACIVGTFYDTSTAEDIHLNDLVANLIIRNTPAPMLKMDQKSNHVLVSHVNDVGDLMIQLPNEDLKFVQRSIDRIKNDSSEQQRVSFADLLHDQLVCVCDDAGDSGKQWYRGMLTSKPKNPEDEVFDVYYVDDGRLRKTHISNIYCLEACNHALASFPAQALRVRLHDVPPIDAQMVGRLRGLLSPQTPVLLKVMEGANDKLPMVTIHARGQDSLYLCLNSAIRMEYEVQTTTRLEPFDDGGLHFSSTGQLIRRSSFSSTVSTHSSNGDQANPVGGNSIGSAPSTPRKGEAAAGVKLSLPPLKEYEAIPALGAYFEVRVALSVNPGHFAVQPYKCYNQLQRLMRELQAYCKSHAAQTVLATQLAIGQSYAAADTDGVYHRVNIRKIYDEVIHVRYVDAGDDGVVRCNQLLQLTPEFRELPMMALPAQLHGVTLTDIDWTQENCVRFRKLTLGQKFIGIVRRVDKLKDGRRALSLELIDTTTPQDIKVHEILINEKQALPAP